jgi:DNA end-binding protein Ku
MNMSARAIWKGSLSFGLVTVPVKAYKATDDPSSETGLRMLHATCNTPINQVTRCTKCNVDVPYSDIIKGFAQDDGTFVVLSKEELDSIKPESSDVIRIESFVKVTDIDSLYVRDTYYLSPDSGASESYALLRAACDSEGLAGQGQWSVYGREHNVIVRACNGGLAVQMMRTVNEVRPMDVLPGYQAANALTLNPAMFKLAKQLITANVQAFDHTDYEDGYVTEFKALVTAKISGVPQPGKPVAKATVPAGDLMAALTASLAHKAPAKKRVAKPAKEKPVAKARKKAS